MRFRHRIILALACAVVLLSSSAPALSGVHLWRVKEVFSNGDGSIQFIEIATCCGSTTENFLSGQQLHSNTNAFTFPANVSGTTLNKHVLLGTSAYAALPGAPTPDHIIPANFFSTGSDTISFSVYDTLIFGAGQMPTDGTTSLNKNPDDPGDTIVAAVNSPTNFAGQTGTISATSGPPGVRGAIVASAVPDGSTLQIAFDAASCPGAADHHILYGQKSGLPNLPGGVFTLLGSVCRIGNASPYTWTAVPRSDDGSGLIWFLVVATDSQGVEGSWGRDSKGAERLGPGNNGASGVCAVTKSIANACGG